MSTYPARGSKLGQHGCRVKYGDSRTKRSRDIRAANFVMESDGRRTMPFDVAPENTAACSSLLNTCWWVTSGRQSMIFLFFHGLFKFIGQIRTEQNGIFCECCSRPKAMSIYILICLPICKAWFVVDTLSFGRLCTFEFAEKIVVHLVWK